MQRPRLIDRRGKERLDGLGIADVALERRPLAAGLGNLVARRLQMLQRARADPRVRAQRRQLAGRRAPDAGAAAANDDGLTVEEPVTVDRVDRHRSPPPSLDSGAPRSGSRSCRRPPPVSPPSSIVLRLPDGAAPAGQLEPCGSSRAASYQSQSYPRGETCRIATEWPGRARAGAQRRAPCGRAAPPYPRAGQPQPSPRVRGLAAAAAPRGT